MHSKLKAELLPLDNEIERTLMNLKKVRAVEEETMAEQRDGNQNILAVATGGP